MIIRKLLKDQHEGETMSRMSTSARKILDILRGTELTQKEIIRKSGMTERAVRYILADLMDHQLINIRRTPKDKRLKLYSLAESVF